jgi:hypothetical protein
MKYISLYFAFLVCTQATHAQTNNLTFYKNLAALRAEILESDPRAVKEFADANMEYQAYQATIYPPDRRKVKRFTQGKLDTISALQNRLSAVHKKVPLLHDLISLGLLNSCYPYIIERKQTTAERLSKLGIQDSTCILVAANYPTTTSFLIQLMYDNVEIYEDDLLARIDAKLEKRKIIPASINHTERIHAGYYLSGVSEIDRIILNSTLLDLSNRKELIRAAYETLRPGGQMVITKEDFMIGCRSENLKLLPDFRKALKRVGFQLVKTSNIQGQVYWIYEKPLIVQVN